MSHAELFSTTLGERGQLVLPARLLQRLNLRPGDRLIVTADEAGDVRMAAAREQARRLRGLFGDLAPGRSLAVELMAERREEAGNEPNSCDNFERRGSLAIH